MPARVPVSERFYRVLLHCYPRAFRDRFSEEMVQLVGDQLRDAHTRRSSRGPMATWFGVIADLIVTAPTEHLRRDSTVARSLIVAPSPMIRALGIAGVLGGLLLVAAFVPDLPWTRDLFIGRLVLFNAGAIAIAVSITRRLAPAHRTAALVAAVPAVVANAIYLLLMAIAVAKPGEVSFGDYVPGFRFAGVAMWLTDAWFGFIVLRLGGVWRLPALALGVGSILAAGGDGYLGLVSGPLAPIVVPLALIGVAMNGIAWIGLGLDVATRRVHAVGSASAPPDA